MKTIRRILSFAAALCLLFTAQTAAGAEEVEEDERFEGKTWDEVIENFLSEHDIAPEKVALGYKNTVTGEEHYLNGDEYHIAASMQKVPLNMIYTEKIYNGEMTTETEISGVAYGKMLEWSIVNSDNSMTWLLWNNLGTFREYREILAPYMGEDPETVDPKFLKDNYFTAREVIYCLNLLQTQSERFPGVIDAMLRAEPDNYFKHHEQSCEVAHKYGYLWAGYTLYVNDCGIAFTDEPIVLVMFTLSVPKSSDVLADYCTLMIDYAQYHTAKTRAEEEKKAEEERAAEEAEKAKKAEEAAEQETATAEPIAAEGDAETVFDAQKLAVPAGILLILALVYIFILQKRKK